MSFRYLLLAFWLLALPMPLWAQPGEADELILAENKFASGDYGGALALYRSLHEASPGSPFIRYRLGLCYLRSPNQQANAAEHLEYAAQYRSERVPAEVYYELGHCYHLLYRFDEAVAQFRRYLEAGAAGEALQYRDAARQIEMCGNATALMAQPERQVAVEILGPPVNSSYNDYAPVVRPNGGLLLFSSDRNTESVDIVFGDQYVFLPERLKSPTQDVFQSYPRGIDWNYPYPQNLEAAVVVPLSLREQGSELLLYISEEGKEGDLYLSRHKGSRWTAPRKLGSRINSRSSRERGGCFAMNGKALYFASDRLGGYGGFDLYVCYQEGRDWGRPINLGPAINTPYDDLAPFMLADEKTFYFSSQGHNSMGGFDLFTATLMPDGQWTAAENLGHPVNTPFNEMHFVQRADGKQAFFSSDRAMRESVGGQDIVGVYTIEKANPMAIVKGEITVTQDGRPLPVTLKVFEKQSRQPQRYVYNPEGESGRYFMILTPRMNYELQIHAGLGEPYLLDVAIPEDAYSYELNQHIALQPVSLYGETIGQKVLVLNDSSEGLRPVEGAGDPESIRYDALLLLMDRIVDAQDREQLESLNALDQQGLRAPALGPDPYYTPIINRVDEVLGLQDAELLRRLGRPDMKKDVIFEGVKVDSRKLVARYRVAFGAKGKFWLLEHESGNLADLSELLRQHPGLHLEVAYADLSGPKAQEQAEAVQRYFLAQEGLSRRNVLKVKTNSIPPSGAVELRLYEDYALFD
jgi:tetratricopeptide (TPR) repeat protein